MGKVMAITEYEDKIQEIIDKNDHDGFIADFLSVYEKIPLATITKLRKGIGRVNLSKEPGEVYLKNKLYYKATDQPLMQTYADLEKKVDELGSKPRYIFVTDFKEILAKDTKTNDSLSIKFKDLPQYFDFFLAWNGIEKADFDKENPADVRAAERFAKLYDIITKDNPDASPHGLNLFLIRLLFCLFAEDTGIFEQDRFTNDVMAYTKADGSDFNDFIKILFENLDVQESLRSASLPGWIKKYPYVDGDLFIEPHESLLFTAESRSKIVDAGKKLNWDSINPDILGSMLQAVAAEDVRSHLGMHYTSVPNIMKVIKPLFLDELRSEFDKAKGDMSKLQTLYDRLGKIKFMDPACGSGNFLVVTYKELRQLEIDILKEENNLGMATMYIPSVTLNQFYGIEIDDFACDVARLSLWIAEHQMNKKLSEEVADAVRPTLPLQHVGGIVQGNALRLNWSEVMSHETDEECYLFGNPPYLGSSKQSATQKADLDFVFGKEVKSYRKLDYISAWFYKGCKIISNTNTELGFVTTNSICQGEQVPILWNAIFKEAQIKYAYTSFKWNNNAKNNAGVTVNIIGLTSRHKNVVKYLYSDNSYKIVPNISPYLTSGTETIVGKANNPLFELPPMTRGNMPIDGNNLIIDPKDYLSFVDEGSSKYIKKFIGSKEYLDSTHRYCIWLPYKNESDEVKSALQYELVRARIKKTKEMRLESKNSDARKLAETPWKFRDTRLPKSYSLVVPAVSSENREYVPMGIADWDTICSNSIFCVFDAPIWVLGILQSKMHMLWFYAIGGKLETRFRYSSTLVYNTFPIPDISKRRKNQIEQLALEILDIREEEGGSLADLYGSPLANKNPKPMNSRLLKAHQELDQVVDRAYKSSGFKDDGDRLSMLLKMYQERVKEQDGRYI